MRYYYTFLLLLLVNGLGYAQIPNAGFEQWAGVSPAEWVSLTLPGTIVQSTTAYSGSSAVRGNVVESSGFGYPPVLVAGPDGEGFPVSQRHATLTGYYQFTPAAGDVFLVTVVMIQSGQPIGVGGFVAPSSQTSYVQFSAPIAYVLGGNPDTCYIQVQIADTLTGLVNNGSFFLLDDLAFVGVSDVRGNSQIPAEVSLFQNFPNPFNPSTTIRFEIPRSASVSLKVYDVLGREVATLADEPLAAGKYERVFEATGLASGMYSYRLVTGEFTQTKKLLLLR